MKQIKILFFIFISLALINCDNDRCDNGYTEVNKTDGSSYCLKNFESGIQNRIDEFGNIFYHKTHGIIKFKNGKWHNEFNEIVIILD